MTAEDGQRFIDARIIPDSIDWSEWEHESEHRKVLPASSFDDAVVDSFLADEQHKGAMWPWAKANSVGLRYRHGEVSLLAGINGHMKSLLMSQVAVSLMAQGEPCMIASFEMAPAKTLHRAVRQSLNHREPHARDIRAWSAWTDGKLWLYDHLGDVQWRKVIAVCRYAAKELGVKHVFIDSLMKCVLATDDHTETKTFVSKLIDLSRECNIHVHLVAHARKKESELDRIGKPDVYGGVDIVNQVDNLIIIQRNKKNERNDENGLRTLVDPSAPGVWLEVVKQRDGAYEGTFGLWFNVDSLALQERPDQSWPKIITERF